MVQSCTWLLRYSIFLICYGCKTNRINIIQKLMMVSKNPILVLHIVKENLFIEPNVMKMFLYRFSHLNCNVNFKYKYTRTYLTFTVLEK